MCKQKSNKVLFFLITVLKFFFIIFYNYLKKTIEYYHLLRSSNELGLSKYKHINCMCKDNDKIDQENVI